ncbi:MAG: DUF2062 domain-containing protein [Bdellovibrionaceae bacterium]|nr:DUF2062 domain-containing protein [Pseudobdellovibrionaceae bacterium]
MILRLCVVIPTYNNPESVAAVVREVLAQTPYPVLVVDDGSDIPVLTRLGSEDLRPHLESARLNVLRLSVNRGKGNAIQRALRACVEKGFTHILTMDADGQHLTSEVAALIKVAQEHPWDLVIGARKFQTAGDVPSVSKFGRRFSNFWVQFQTGLPVSDSQSGFRLYPLFQLQNMKFWCRRYDFEIEVLIKSMWKGVQIRETEIEVYYPDQDKRVSHFHKLWDNVRISILNTALVVLSLLNSHHSAREAAFAVGAGAFIGTTPFFGFHTLIVAIVAFALRLNAVYLWLGTHVSMPPIAPFLILGSIWIGSTLVPSPEAAALTWDQIDHLSLRGLLHEARLHLAQWMAGSLILGAILGLVLGSLTYLLVRRFHAKKRLSASWNGRVRGGRFGNGFLRFVIQNIGLRAGYVCLYFIIPYFYLFAPKARRSLKEYWHLQKPDAGFFGSRQLILKHLFRFGQVLMDRIAKNFGLKEGFETRSHGVEHILAAREASPGLVSPGLILLTAHVGGWDFAASLLDKTSRGFYIAEYQSQERKFSDVKGPDQMRHLKQFTPDPGAGISVMELYTALGQGNIVGLMGDRPMGQHYELVKFCGRLAPFDTTPFRLAAAAKAAVIFTFGFKDKGREYEFFAEPARFYRFEPGRDRDLQCIEWAQEYASCLERMLRRHPEQWFNFYPFWSTIPVSPLSEGKMRQGHRWQEELQTPSGR